jgi:hypothetical protein
MSGEGKRAVFVVGEIKGGFVCIIPVKPAKYVFVI